MSQINFIIEKYLAGKSSLEEESQIKAYLLSEEVHIDHLDLVPLFEYYGAASQFELADDTSVADFGFQSISNLVDKYWAGNTTLAEERLIGTYLKSDKVSLEHQEMRPMFAYFEEQESLKMKGSIDLASITGQTLSDLDIAINAYWEGESSLEQETLISNYVAEGDVSAQHAELIPLFSYFAKEKAIILDKELDLGVSRQPEAEVEPKVRFMFPKVMAVAASLALLLMVTFNFMEQDASYKNTYTEVEDPAEALEITMEALAFLGKKYDKGTKPMKYIKEFEKTEVFRFTK